MPNEWSVILDPDCERGYSNYDDSDDGNNRSCVRGISNSNGNTTQLKKSCTVLKWRCENSGRYKFLPVKLNNVTRFNGNSEYLIAKSSCRIPTRTALVHSRLPWQMVKYTRSPSH